jgi:hypothetical protein
MAEIVKMLQNHGFNAWQERDCVAFELEYSFADGVEEQNCRVEVIRVRTMREAKIAIGY